MSKHVEFVSYDGKFPNLCTGKLVLRIDGKPYTFYFDTRKPGVDYGSFWHSSGCVMADAEWNFTVTQRPWEFNEEALPHEFKKYADEIFDAFSENVEPGYCGGCI